MESSQFSLPKALEYLSEIQEHINEVRLQNESTCRDIKQLLNKPWPGKTSPASSSLAGTQEGSRGSASAPEHSTDDNVFSVVEQSMLAEVDSVLAQAQKLRQFQSKVKSKQTSSSKQDKNSPIAVSAPNYAEPPKSTMVAEPSITPDQQNNQESQGELTNQNTNNSGGDATDVAVISARDLDRLLKKDPPTRKEQTSKLTRPTSGTTKLSKQPKSKRTAPGASGVTRPASRTDTQLRTSSAEIGRHISKPVSRFGNAQSKYMQSAKAKTLAKDNSTKINTQGSGNRPSVRQSSTQGPKKQSSTANRTSNEVAHVPSGKSNIKIEQPSKTQRSTDTLEVDRVTRSVAQLKVSKAHETRSGDTHQETKTSPSTEADLTPHREKIPFMLRRDGASLTVPSKLKKHYQNDAKLRDKLTSLIHGDGSSHSDQFLDLFGDNTSYSLQLDAELQRLTAEYQHLIQLTRDVRKQLHAIHGKTPWEDVYYLHAISEIIRQRQAEISKQFCQLKDGLKDGTDVTVSRSSHKTKNSSPFLWHQVNNFKDELFSIPDGNILQYSSRAELLKWNELVYRIQHIQQEKIIQEVAGDTILELLSGIDCEDPSYPTLYRISHGLILNSASVYPSMISDEERGITPGPEF